MINRARRALPGMVMTLFLSAPAWAAPGHDATATIASARHDAKPAATGQKVAARAARTTSAGTRTASINIAPERAHGLVRTKSRAPSPASTAGAAGRSIRHVSLHTAGASMVDRRLIEDGTLWRDPAGASIGQQTGMASWYGGTRWQGHRTTSGSHYDQDELTAAHATLPLGTRVKVMRADGGGSVIVTINDRPGTRTRIIDLSRAAAKELGILNAGVAMVTLQPM